MRLKQKPVFMTTTEAAVASGRNDASSSFGAKLSAATGRAGVDAVVTAPVSFGGATARGAAVAGAATAGHPSAYAPDLRVVAPPPVYQYRFPFRRLIATLVLVAVGFSLLIAGLAIKSIAMSLSGAFMLIPGLWLAWTFLQMYRGHPAYRMEEYYDLEASIPTHVYGGLGQVGSI